MKGESDNANPGMVESIFHAALGFSGAERIAYLTGASGNDLQLRQRVEALLKAHDEAQGFLPEQPADATTVTLESETPGTVIGRYKLLEKIGEGGFGAVYVAEQKEPVRRRVALKIIKLGMDTRQVVARFEVERQALALMDHPNIAKVLDAGATQTGRPYFVMELVRGIKITEYCDQNNLSTGQRLDLFMQVCRAIQHAHQKGIIHRDIKPSNILVTLHDGVPVPKVIDFGIAKATQGELSDKTVYTQFQQFIGTPAYMSPEQAEMSGLDIDTRSDIYSLGVLLYELLTGKTPFDAKELLEAGLDAMRRTIREKEPVRPSTRVGALSGEELTTTAKRRGLEAPKLINLLRGDLDWIVMKALEKDRTRRYETANGFASDIRRFLNNEPVTAVAPSTGYKLRKFVRRNRKAVIAASAFVVLLILATYISASLAVILKHAIKQETEANRQLNRQILETEKQRMLAEQALQRMQIQKAEQAFEAGDSPAALAYLAGVLRQCPTNRVAAERLTSALSHRSFALPSLEPIRHGAEVRFTRFSVDGQHVLTVSHDVVRIWEAATGRLRLELRKPGGGIDFAEISPDGQRVMTISNASKDGQSLGTAQLWDVQTGKLQAELVNPGHHIYLAQFSSDGQRVVSSSLEERLVRVWDTKTGAQVIEPLKHDERTPSSRSFISHVENSWIAAQFSPDGKRIATISSQLLRIWDASAGQPILTITKPEVLFQWSPTQYRSPIFSPDGRRLLTACADNTARIWDADTGALLVETERGRDSISETQFSPDGFRIVTASFDHSARIWDAQSGLPVTPPLLHKGMVVAAEFSPDGERVVTTTAALVARIWDARTGQPLSDWIEQLPVPVNYQGGTLIPPPSARFSPDGRRVVIAARPDAAQVWDVQRGQTIDTIIQHEGFSDYGLAPDGMELITVSSNGLPTVWKVDTGLPAKKQIKPLEPVVIAGFTRDGRRILTASRNGSWSRWDSASGQLIGAPLHLKGTIWFGPDGEWLLATTTNSVAFWDVRSSPRLVRRIDNDNYPTFVFYSQDGRYAVVTPLGPGGLRPLICDVRTGQPLGQPLNCQTLCEQAEFGPDGQRLATAQGDGTDLIWDFRTGQSVGKPMNHATPVRLARFSPSGDRVATVSSDGIGRVWSIATGQLIAESPKQKGMLRLIHFSRDGLRVLTGSNEKIASVWDAETGQPLIEPISHDRSISFGEFGAQGEWVITASGLSTIGMATPHLSRPEWEEGTVRITEIAPAPVPVPGWILELAEAMAGQRLNARAAFEAVDRRELMKLKQRVEESSSRDSYTRWAKWFFGDRAERTVSSSSSITISEYVHRRVHQNTLASLREAILISPTNSLAFARLAQKVLEQDPKENPRRLGEADFFSRYAVKLSPNDPEIAKIRRLIEERIAALKTR